MLNTSTSETFEFINVALKKSPKLRFPVGLQLLEMGLYWVQVSMGDEFLKDYITSYFRINSQRENLEN